MYRKSYCTTPLVSISYGAVSSSGVGVSKMLEFLHYSLLYDWHGADRQTVLYIDRSCEENYNNYLSYLISKFLQASKFQYVICHCRLRNHQKTGEHWLVTLMILNISLKA